jgi:hypothetical protein
VEQAAGGEWSVFGVATPESRPVQEGVAVATSADRQALYTTLQGLNKRSNLRRKGLSGPPLAPRS